MYKLDRIQNGSMLYFTPTKFVEKVIRPFLPNKIPIETIHYPVTPAATTRQNPAGSDHMLWIGRMTKEKDVVTPAMAAKETNTKLNFVGSGEEADRAKEILPEAIFHGWLPTDKVAELHRNCRALVMSSIWYETSSLVVLESLGAGIPAVIPNTSAATEWVQDGFNGFHFEAGNPESLKAIFEKLKDDELVETLSKNAFEQYWSHPYTQERYMNQLLGHYRDLLASR